ncbi:MAG: 50S ribosomal protein L32 [Candidatus Levybacteria bacterium RIFCSPHIGHO2_02_FULL_42_12]|nr:MAG: 50S ribosomal protein L32 [Candidatus Levybacteria bacterium RIFCSPHIGHO2_01_FULL_42_15]OGH30865.1 MAG: 50S ribosomal protein L32 [Candidatus Levybacteria bacterium RIFCSPHIGHO2_02_FULL_42_12]OGH42105.1 MAG: 50S ribosomal protein L32 [Candidatus Levybacteria bacterium RIFCSPLOWO2_01_FULL_42_15]
MPQEPKKRHSRARQGKRRASIFLSAPIGAVCSQCKKIIPSHTVCKHCGYYRGKAVVVKKSTRITQKA